VSGVSARRLALASLAGVVLALGVVGPAPASQSDQVILRQVDTTGYPTISVTVSVPRTVAPDQISITENGKPVNILNVRPLAETGRTFDVVLAIDTSNSVAGAPLAAAVSAAQSFVRGLPPGVRAGIVTFDAEARILQPFTSDRTRLLEALSALRQTRLHTTLYDAVFVASGMFSGAAQHDVVLLTDGKDIGSQRTLDEAITEATSNKVTLFTIGLGPSVDTRVLQSLARQSGGTYAPADRADLEAIYERLVGQLSNQYVVTYSSSAPQGAQVTLGVSAPEGSDRSFVLMPTLPQAPARSTGGLNLSLTGTIGMAVALGLCFLAVMVAAWLLLASAAHRRRDRELARRMSARTWDEVGAGQGRAQGSRTPWIPQPVVEVAEGFAKVTGLEGVIEHKLERAAWPMAAGEFISITAIAAILAALVGIALNNVVLALVLALTAAIVPYLFLDRSEDRRVERLAQQLPDALMILASTMRAGHSCLQALDTASKEIGEPSAPEFARIVAEIRLGRRPDEALTALAERVGTEEFRWAMMAVNVQREVGGNLAEILDTLADTVREREAVRRQVRVLSAEGRLSMKILILVPPLLVLYMLAVRPDYVGLLWTTTAGLIMVGIASILMVVAVLVARRIVRIDV
jgi:tight adherence protein B